MEIENAFSRPGKVMDLGKMAEVMEKLWNFVFGPAISCCLKIAHIRLVIEQRCAPKRPGFQHFIVMENLNWLWKRHRKVIEFYCPISV